MRLCVCVCTCTFVATFDEQSLTGHFDSPDDLRPPFVVAYAPSTSQTGNSLLVEIGTSASLVWCVEEVVRSVRDVWSPFVLRHIGYHVMVGVLSPPPTWSVERVDGGPSL